MDEPVEPANPGGAANPAEHESDPALLPPRLTPPLLATFGALLLAVVLQAGLGLAVVAWLLVAGIPAEEIGDRATDALGSAPMGIAMMVLGPGAFGLVAVYAAMRAPGGFRDTLGLFPVREPVKAYGLTMVGSIVPLAAAIYAARFVAQYTPSVDGFEAFFEGLTPLWGALFVLVIAAAPGVCEELLFRGYIQRRLIQRWGPVWGIGCASVLFALAHVMPPAIAVALPLGVWLGVIAWRTGSVGPSIACHAFVNGGINTWRLVSKFAGLSDETHQTVDACFFAIGLVAFVGACVWLARYEREPAAGDAREA